MLSRRAAGRRSTEVVDCASVWCWRCVGSGGDSDVDDVVGWRWCDLIGDSLVSIPGGSGAASLLCKFA